MPLINMKQVQGGKELQGNVSALLDIIGKDKDAFFNGILNWLLSEAPQDFNPEILRNSRLVKLVNSAVTVNNESDVSTKTPYLSFIEENSEPFTIKFFNDAKSWDGILEYSTNTQNWSEWDGVEISSSDDGKLYLRGAGNTKLVGNSGSGFTLTDNKRIQCIGNIENLLDYVTVSAGNHPVMAAYCYYSMFNGCTSLTTAPQLPATTLAKQCYRKMFRRCTSLTTPPPQLPATTLADYCYLNMFEGCTSLTGTIHCPAPTSSDSNRLDTSTGNLPANTATVVYDL